MVPLMKFQLIIGLVCITSLCGCAMVSGDMENRIGQLENQNSALEKRLTETEQRLKEQDKTNGKLLSSSAETNADLDTLQQDISTLTGRMEEVEHKMKSEWASGTVPGKDEADRLSRMEETFRTNGERIAKLEHYLDMKATSGKSGGNAAATAASAASMPVVSPATDGEALTDTDLYTRAKNAYDNAQYDVARGEFQKLIQKFPKSKDADNAQFWIGETYFRQKWYEKAISEYQKVIEDYPDGNKVPAAYLKQGLAFYNLNDEATARLVLQKTIDTYPKSNEAKIARDKLKTFK